MRSTIRYIGPEVHTHTVTLTATLPATKAGAGNFFALDPATSFFA